MSGLDMKYFVLNPTKNDKYGEASRKAILKYAHIIKYENSEMSNDLMTWVLAIEEEFPKEIG